MIFGKKAVGVFLALLLVVSGVATAANVGGVNWDSDAAPNSGDDYVLTKAEHNMSWGVSDSDARYYEDDGGDLVKVDAIVNESADNAFSYYATDVENDDFGAFPVEKDNVSALDAAEWNTSGLTVSDVETAPDVEALRVQTNGSMTSGDSVSATFSNFSITSDESKRHLALVLDADSIDAGTVVLVEVEDEDGDKKVAEINTSRTSGEDLITNATGTGIVFQRQLGEMDTVVGGDGTFNNMEKVNVVVKDGDADLSFAGVNVEKFSKYDFGTEMRNTDDEDDLEKVEIEETKTGGLITIASLSSIGDSFSEATIHDLQIDMVGSPEVLDDEDVSIEKTETDKFPGYKGTATIYVRLGLEDSYDLSYAGAERTDMQSVTSDRIISVKYAEGVSDDTDFDEIEDSAWTDKTDLYTGEEKNVTIDDTLQPGQDAVLKYELKLDENQFESIDAESGSGGTGDGAKTGGLSGIPLIGGILVAVIGFVRRYLG